MDAANLVFMGTSVVQGTATAVAFATGADTQFGQIYQMTTQVTEVASPLQRNVNRMARQVSTVAVALAALVFGLRAATTSAGLVDSFVFALGVMVALVPEGLPATLSVSLAIGVRRMAKKNALIKKLLAVETLGSTTVICTDKTGTLTEGNPKLVTVTTANDWEDRKLLRLAASLERASEHPLAAAIVGGAEDRDVELTDAEDFASLTGKGVTGKVDGHFSRAGQSGIVR